MWRTFHVKNLWVPKLYSCYFTWLAACRPVDVLKDTVTSLINGISSKLLIPRGLFRHNQPLCSLWPRQARIHRDLPVILIYLAIHNVLSNKGLGCKALCEFPRQLLSKGHFHKGELLLILGILIVILIELFPLLFIAVIITVSTIFIYMFWGNNSIQQPNNNVTTWTDYVTKILVKPPNDLIFDIGPVVSSHSSALFWGVLSWNSHNTGPKHVDLEMYWHVEHWGHVHYTLLALSEGTFTLHYFKKASCPSQLSCPVIWGFPCSNQMTSFWFIWTQTLQSQYIGPVVLCGGMWWGWTPLLLGQNSSPSLLYL